MSKKSISKADLGMTPTKKKGNLTPMELRELKKATEMAKPVNRGLEDYWCEYKRLLKKAEYFRTEILKFMPQSLKDGFRQESFIYVKESVIPDREAIESWYCNIGKALPRMTKIETDWKLAQKELGKDCPMKKKVAYLREVTR